MSKLDVNEAHRKWRHPNESNMKLMAEKVKVKLVGECYRYSVPLLIVASPSTPYSCQLEGGRHKGEFCSPLGRKLT